MTIRTIPGAPSGRPSADMRSNISPMAFDRWDGSIRAADSEEDRTISVYDVIGQDYWTGEGVTAKRIAGVLRMLGAGPVTVNINSPGGDMFEGLAIYNLLREHKGEVTVKVIGLAASSASIIAMAGDNIQIARAGFLMMHNCWVMAIGNKDDLRATADTLEPFDSAMAGIYAARTGTDIKAMSKLMDGETWINGSDAIDKGFADELLASDQTKKTGDKAKASAIRRVESALRASGMTRTEAQTALSEFKSSLRDSAGSGEGDPTERNERDSVALSETAALAASLTNLFRS